MRLEDIPEEFRSLAVAYVYAIRCGRWLVKIGCAQDVQKRLRGIGGGNPFQLTVENCLRTPFGQQEKVERRLHRILRDDKKHVRGEWFSMTAGTVTRLFLQMTQEFDGVEFCESNTGMSYGLRPGQRNFGSNLIVPGDRMERDVIGREMEVSLIRQQRSEW